MGKLENWDEFVKRSGEESRYKDNTGDAMLSMIVVVAVTLCRLKEKNPQMMKQSRFQNLFLTNFALRKDDPWRVQETITRREKIIVLSVPVRECYTKFILNGILVSPAFQRLEPKKVIICHSKGFISEILLGLEETGRTYSIVYPQGKPPTKPQYVKVRNIEVDSTVDFRKVPFNYETVVESDFYMGEDVFYHRGCAKCDPYIGTASEIEDDVKNQGAGCPHMVQIVTVKRYAPYEPVVRRSFFDKKEYYDFKVLPRYGYKEQELLLDNVYKKKINLRKIEDISLKMNYDYEFPRKTFYKSFEDSVYEELRLNELKMMMPFFSQSERNKYCGRLGIMSERFLPTYETLKPLPPMRYKNVQIKVHSPRFLSYLYMAGTMDFSKLINLEEINEVRNACHNYCSNKITLREYTTIYCKIVDQMYYNLNVLNQNVVKAADTAKEIDNMVFLCSGNGRPISASTAKYTIKMEAKIVYTERIAPFEETQISLEKYIHYNKFKDSMVNFPVFPYLPISPHYMQTKIVLAFTLYDLILEKSNLRLQRGLKEYELVLNLLNSSFVAEYFKTGRQLWVPELTTQQPLFYLNNEFYTIQPTLRDLQPLQSRLLSTYMGDPNLMSPQELVMAKPYLDALHDYRHYYRVVERKLKFMNQNITTQRRRIDFNKIIVKDKKDPKNKKK